MVATIDGRCGRIALAVTLIVVLFVALLVGGLMHAASMRGIDARYAEAMREGFAAGTSFQRHPKNGVYNDFIKYFYSNGDANTSGFTIMFTPSVTDVACMQFQSSISASIICGTDEGSAPLDTLSLRDDRASLGVQPYETCSSRAVALGPVDRSDATLRVLSGMYALNKTCVQMQVIPAPQLSGSDYTLRLPTDAQETLFFVLSRPVFVTSADSFVYHVQPMFTAAEYQFGISGDFTYVDVKLNRVHEPMMYGRGLMSTRRALPTVTSSSGPSRVALTLYYLSFQHPVQRGLTDVSFDPTQVATLVFAVDQTRLSSLDWFTLDAPELRVAYNNETGEVAPKVAGGGGYNVAGMQVGQHGYLVLVYTTNLIIMCHMARGRVRIRSHASGITSLAMDAAQKQALQNAAAKYNAAPPAACYPCQLFGIPNLYDVYAKLVGTA